MRVVLGILIILVSAATVFLLGRDLVPPKTVTIASGSEGGGYWTIAQSYRDILLRNGIDATIVETAGSVENVQLLADGKVDAILLQGGITPMGDVEMLASLFFEPLFVFVRNDSVVPSNPGAWNGLRLATGAEGSGTSAAVDTLFTAANIPKGGNTRLQIGGATAADALLAADVDAALFVAPIETQYLQPLLSNTEISLLSVAPLTALSRAMPQAQMIALPAGSLTVHPPLPEKSVAMIGMVAQLMASSSLHPSLVDRLVEAAREEHSSQSALANSGRFPAAEPGMRQMDAYARSLLEDGPSPLQEFLPYWVVAQINRFAILLLPILILLIPIIRAVPALYGWRMRARVFRHYTTIREIDCAALDTGDVDTLSGLESRLTTVDRDLADLRLPAPYRDYAYTARLHVDLIRQRIRDKIEQLG